MIDQQTNADWQDFKSTLEDKTLEALKLDLIKILALCENPHWNTGRKYKIEELATDCLNRLKRYGMK